MALMEENAPQLARPAVRTGTLSNFPQKPSLCRRSHSGRHRSRPQEHRHRTSFWD